MRKLHICLSKHTSFPKRLRRPELWIPGNLPYAYPNLKRGCIQSGVGVVCEKNKDANSVHLCVRRICSFWKVPSRSWFRTINRCLSIALYEMGYPEGARSLSAAPDKIRMSCQDLVQSDEWKHACNCCHRPKRSLCITNHDATNCFESLTKEEQNASQADFFEEAKSDHKGVMIKKNGKREGYMAKHCFANRGAKFKFFPWEELICAMLIMRLLSKHVFMGKVLTQLVGVAIGGPLSSVVNAMNMRYWMKRWRLSPGVRESKGWHDNFGFLYVSMTLYEDEMCQISRVYCRNCMTRRLLDIFIDSGIEWKTDPFSSSYSWLDMSVQNCSGTFVLSPLKHEVEWVLSREAFADKTRGPSFVSQRYFREPECMLQGVILGKFQRWTEIFGHESVWDGETVFRIRSHILYELCLWPRLGYHACHLRSLFRSLRFPAYSRWASDWIRRASFSCR